MRHLGKSDFFIEEYNGGIFDAYFVKINRKRSISLAGCLETVCEDCCKSAEEEEIKKYRQEWKKRCEDFTEYSKKYIKFDDYVKKIENFKQNMPYVIFNFVDDLDDICYRPELNYDNKETEIIFPYIMNMADHHITYVSIALAVAYTILFKRGKIKENEIIYLKQEQKRIYQSYMSRFFYEVLLSNGEISKEEYEFLRNRQKEITEETVIYNEE